MKSFFMGVFGLSLIIVGAFFGEDNRWVIAICFWICGYVVLSNTDNI